MTITVALVVAALICLILSAVGKIPLWVSVLLLILAALVGVVR
jgi:hypothetical protein